MLPEPGWSCCAPLTLTVRNASPISQRNPIRLASWGGDTQAEIAPLTATPLPVVRTRMLATLRALVGQLPPW